MTITLKPLDQQVVVILGASSGIGRETALRFAAAGARLVVAARGDEGLRSLIGEVRDKGGDAILVRCDVVDADQVRAVADAAVERFGRIDTWVNVAAVSVYALFEETTPDEFRRIMDVNFVGQVNGAQAALPHLKKDGGALIAVSSVESIVALPLHSAYSASKHAVEGMIDALRRELMAEKVPVSVTSIKPATINTPFFTNSRNKMDVKPKGPPPFYAPGVVADCILHAAAHPVRDLFAGGAAKSMAVAQMRFPKLVDAALARFGIPSSRTHEPQPDGSEGNLDAPSGDARAAGDFAAQAHRVSPYTWLEMRPRLKLLLASGAVAGALLLTRDRPPPRIGDSRRVHT